MTEERFEQLVEGAADRLDKSMNRAWQRRPVRMVCRAVSFLIGAGLMASAAPLAERGSRTAAKVCLIGGGLIFMCELLQAILFRKK